jgi:broad specificity phosphatase PhoE
MRNGASLALLPGLVALALLAAAPAQDPLPAPTRRSLTLGDRELSYQVHEPATPGVDGFRPLLLLCGDALGTAEAMGECARLAADLAAAGFVTVRPLHHGVDPDVARPTLDPLLAELPARLRQQFAIAGGGMHLLALRGVDRVAMELALARPWEFQSITLVGRAPPPPAGATARLGNRCVAWFTPPGEPGAALVDRFRHFGVKAKRCELPAAADLPAAVLRHLHELHAERAPAGPAGAVAHALDRFHDAASKGDEATYFAMLPDDAVYLGTDASERWTGAEFRAFALPWFQRGPAWVYVPTARHVTMLSGDLAAFGELLDNEAYGECRGSGVLERRGGHWVVRQYDLSVPIPNELARAVVGRIRAAAAGLAPPCTTMVIVRHAEKVDDSSDPGLSAAGEARAARLAQMLAELPVTAVFATEYRRTQDTVGPLARAKHVEPRVVAAADGKALARTLQSECAGGMVVVAAHSNTIPILLRALGVPGEFTVADDDYGGLFVVTVADGTARCLRLRY